MNRGGIGSVLRIMDAGKGSRVWERKERIMNFNKSEKSVEKSQPRFVLSLSILPFSFSLFDFLSLSPLSLS